MSTVDELEKKVEGELERVRALETQIAVMQSQQKDILSKLNNLSGGINRGLWILGGGFIAAFVTWVVNGGFLSR